MPQSKKSAKKFGIFPYGKLLGDVLESPRGNTCRLQGPTRADSGGSKNVGGNIRWKKCQTKSLIDYGTINVG